MNRSARLPTWLLILAAVMVGVLAGAMLHVRGAAQPAPAGNDAPLPAQKISGLKLDTVLGDLAMLGETQTRSVSAENPTGEKGMAAKAVPNPADPDLPHSAAATELGQGWKVRPFLRPRAGQTVTLMDVNGPGVIQHFWIVPGEIPRDGRSSVLRVYWDGEASPSIEVPVADFFAVGHARFAPVNSRMITAMPLSGLSCFWPMPFRKHAKVTFSNDGKKDIDVLAYQITYAKCDVPENAGYFHAQWRRARATQQNPYVILDGVKGRGQYVGTFLAYGQGRDGWFGEGEMKFYIDGDDRFPTYCGTGTEDYFLASYGFATVYNTAFAGVTLKENVRNNSADGNAGALWSMYRWHVMDPIHFQKELRVTIHDLGWDGPKMVKGTDDIASVAYWYQDEPHAEFPPLPPVEERTRSAISTP